MTATLNDIRLKVRRITKSPSAAQITDVQLDQYINTYFIYDFPEELRLFDLRDTVRFFTKPNVDQYAVPGADSVSSGPSSFPLANGFNYTTNLITFLGLDSQAQIVPGSVSIIVGANVPATIFTDPNEDGSLICSDTAFGNGAINYHTSDVNLTFAASQTNQLVTISFEYNTPQFVTVHPPVYIAGYQSFFTQSRDEMFRLYPKNRTIATVSTGTGITGPYTFTLANVPVLRNNVLIDTNATAGVSQGVYDDGAGNLVGDGTGTINYVTGQVSVTFNQIAQNGQNIVAQTVPYVASRPTALMYFADTFTLRPVPDQEYEVSLEIYRRPNLLQAITQSPEIKEWWQLIAYGAALKIFEDRLDMNSYGLIKPIHDEYRNLVERKTIVQLTNERTPTIYVEQNQWPFSNFYSQF